MTGFLAIRPKTADNTHNEDENKRDNGQKNGDDDAIAHEFEDIPVRVGLE